MNWLTVPQKREIARLSAEDPANEACGFVLEDGSVIRVPNVSKDPAGSFEISANDYVRADLCGIRGVWHSHSELDGFSPLDQQVLAQDSVPWAVYCHRTGTFTQCDPDSIAPLIGRPFCFGVYDCYSLVSDFLSEQGVALPQWPRGKWGEWNTPNFKPFDEEAERVGRYVTNGCYQAGDILLFNLGDHSGHTDHVGVFTDSRNFLHHPANGKSRRQTFGRFWVKYLNSVVRPHELWKDS